MTQHYWISVAQQNRNTVLGNMRQTDRTKACSASSSLIRINRTTKLKTLRGQHTRYINVIAEDMQVMWHTAALVVNHAPPHHHHHHHHADSP